MLELTHKQRVIYDYIETLEHLLEYSIKIIDDDHLACKGKIYGLDENNCIVASEMKVPTEEEYKRLLNEVKEETLDPNKCKENLDILSWKLHDIVDMNTEEMTNYREALLKVMNTEPTK